jgi:hypothetical protein
VSSATEYIVLFDMINKERARKQFTKVKMKVNLSILTMSWARSNASHHARS